MTDIIQSRKQIVELKGDRCYAFTFVPVPLCTILGRNVPYIVYIGIMVSQLSVGDRDDGCG